VLCSLEGAALARLCVIPAARAYTQDFNFMLRLVMTCPIPFIPLTKEAVAESLQVSKRTVENWVADGTLPAPRKLGNRVYWHPEVYYNWLSRRLKEEESPPEASPASAKPQPASVTAPAQRQAKASDSAAARLRASTERKLARLQELG